MSSRRVLIEAQDFTRRRAVAALLRGDSLDLQDVPHRPNAALLTGLVLTLLIAAGTAGSAYIAGRAPPGWRDDGTLVLDKATGARFVALAGVLRPAPTLTAARLAGATRSPLLVPHAQLAQATIGLALPGTDLPERPPALPPTPRPLTACVNGPALDVFAGEPAGLALPETGLLAHAPHASAVVLLSGRRAHPVSPDALLALGYSPAQVREVPLGWLSLVPVGSPLARLQPIAGRAVVDGVAGVGADGEVVLAAGSRRRFLIDGGSVHPFVNHSSELLAAQPARELPDSVLLSAPPGPAVGIFDAPAEPPTLPTPETGLSVCVRSSDGLVTLLSAAADRDTRPGPATVRHLGGDAVGMRWHFPPGEGGLVGPLARDPPADGQPIGNGLQLLDGRLGHPVADDAALRALGYRPDQALLLAEPWLALPEPGGPLSTAR